jgi:hypothetical protein
MTGTALVWRGDAEFDPESMVPDPLHDSPWYGTRIRLSEDLLNANGLTRATRLFAGASFGQMQAIQEAIDDEAALAA